MGSAFAARRRALTAAFALLLAVATVAIALLPASAAQNRLPRSLTNPDAFATFDVSHYAPSTVINTDDLGHQGPWSGPIQSVAVDPRDDHRLLVASDNGGVFESADSGDSWVHDDGVPSPFPQAVAFLAVASLGTGKPCPCGLATTIHDFEANGGGGGAYISYTRGGVLHWSVIDQLFGAPPSCPAPAAYGISIAPDTHAVYVATSCGIAVGTAQGTFSRTFAGTLTRDMRAVVALGGGRLVAAGPGGVMYFDGTTWSASRSATGSSSNANANGLSSVNSLARDPRNSSGAFYVDDSTNLWETGNGTDWRAITAVPPFSGCGGIPYVRAVVPPGDPGTFRLYYGNRCYTYVATLDTSSDPATAIGSGSWTQLNAAHPDTHDLVFHDGSLLPYLITSDGGIARAIGLTTFASIGGPTAGLDALEVVDLDAEYVHGTADLYFTTWHDFDWSMFGLSATPAGEIIWEGADLGMPRFARPGEANQITVTNQGPGYFLSGPHYAFRGFFPFAPGGKSEPTFVAPQHYIQDADNGSGRAWELWSTNNSGASGSWWRIANIGRQINGHGLVAGPARDPVLVQPYQDGVSADPAHFSQAIVHIAVLTDFNRYGRAAHIDWMRLASRLHPRTPESGLQSLGVMATTAPWYEVLAVDPLDASHMIAPDVFGADMRRTTNGGDTWTTIRGLKTLLTHDGAYDFTEPISNRLQPIASVISYCPENDSRLLIGTQQGGAYFSFDGGTAWTRIPDSEQITRADKIFWLADCSAAYIATDGRGIWRIDIAVHLRQTPCAPPVCHIVDLERRLLHKPHPWPSPIRGLIVSDGYITSWHRSGKRIRVKVTLGSATMLYPRSSRAISISTSPFRLGKHHGRYRQALMFAGSRLVLTYSDRSPLRTFPQRKGHIGKGNGAPLIAQHAQVGVVSDHRTDGGETALLSLDDPLEVRGVIDKTITGQLLLLIDGQVVYKLAAGQFSFDTVLHKTVSQTVGKHSVTLAVAGNPVHPLAAAEFEIENGDNEKP